MLRVSPFGFLIAVALVSCSAKSSSVGTQPQRELIANSLSQGEKAEFFWSKPAGDGPFPMVVFVHGHQEPASNRIGGRAFVDWGVLNDYSKSGFVAVAVSQPGYGGSEGKPDFCGPRTQGAVKAVIDHFRRSKFVNPNKIVMEGVSRGAVVASMVAAGDSKLRAVVLISGVYDMKLFYNTQCLSGSKTPVVGSICESIRQEMPVTDQGFSDRSARDYASKMKAHVLILHGAEDQNVPPAQAREFADALQKSGGDVELHIFPGFNHHIPLAKRQPIINAFLKRSLDLVQELPQ